MKSSNVTLNSRSVRVVIAVGVAFVAWLFCAARLNHRCLLGYKWFEHYSPMVIASLGACAIVFVRRFWLGASLAAALYLAFFGGVVPAYLAWIHGPNSPQFPAAEARRLNDLQIIDAALEQPTTDNPQDIRK